MTQLSKAFRLLRKQNIIAKSNFLCCQSCACADLYETYKNDAVKPLGYVFYHNQDNARKLKGNDFYLSYGGFSDNTLEAANVITEALKKYNVDFEWSGQTNDRIKIKQ